MKFIIDDANIAKVKEIWDLYPCDGVTTNPSILQKAEEILTKFYQNLEKSLEKMASFTYR